MIIKIVLLQSRVVYVIFLTKYLSTWHCQFLKVNCHLVRVKKSCFFRAYRNSKDPDQPAKPHNLISIFVYTSIYSTVFNVSVSGQRRPRSACPDAQADLGLRCPHRFRRHIFACCCSFLVITLQYIHNQKKTTTKKQQQQERQKKQEKNNRTSYEITRKVT